MKKLILFAILFAIPAWADGPIVGTGTAGTLTTNPAAAAILVTSPALTSNSVNASPSANWIIVVQYYCTVSALFDIQTVNTSSVVVAHTFVPCNLPTGGVGGGGIFNVTNIAFSIPQSYKMQVANVNAMTGQAQASIYYALQNQN
jgi:hypothetical protein